MNETTTSAVGCTAAIIAGAIAAPALAGEEALEVTSVAPAARSMGAAVTASISVEFDQPVAPDTVNRDTFWAFGRWSGTAEGTITLSNGNRTATLDPDGRFTVGESVMVILSHDIESAKGVGLRAGGYSFQFMTRAGTSTRTYEQIDILSTRSGETSRAYGGVAADMNRDGFMDITIVNEDTADLRVFLNKADGTGLFDDFLEPPSPVGNRASPSEPADFNHDGIVDMCVADINDDTVSVLLGNGDGTFAPRQVIDVGGDPRGIAVLDADGDGDVDIVNTNATSSNACVILNDGTGTFGEAAFFEAGVAGEWAAAAADMNEDGLLDMVIAGRSQPALIVVALGGGDGTFTPGTARTTAGGMWMINCGDVNGDGHDDVVGVNSNNGTGERLLGNGTGTLADPVLVDTDPFPLATDLADLDGDGDLDWITSSFSGDWFVFTNDGAGGFTFDQEFLAPDAASCSLPFDFDNDGDLDIALIDELDDVVILMRSVGTPCPADVDGDGTVDFGDLLLVLSAWGPCDACPEDVDGDGTVDFDDLLRVLSAWGPC